MSLVPQVLVRGQLRINALGLKHDADLTSQAGRVLRRIASHHQGAAAGRNHQGGENSEQRGLAAAVRAKQAKQFRRAHVERNSIQRRAVLVAMDNVLYGNDRRGGSWVHFRTGISERSDFRNQIDSPRSYNQFTTSCPLA